MNLEDFKKQQQNQPAGGQRSNLPPSGPPKVTQPGYGRSFPSEGLPAGYLARGYFDEKGNILSQVVIDWPKEIAQKLDAATPTMNVSQLRRFFTEVRHIEGQLAAGKNYDTLRGRILKLDVYAADARKKGGVPDLFKQFIEQNLVWATKTEKDFLSGFVPHFESIVAYFPKKQ